jgi:membrane associated rhomboid family serine protease
VIPLRDTIPSRRTPIATWVIIGLNVLAFLYESILSTKQLESLFMAYGLIPAVFWQEGPLGSLVPLFASMFLHGGWMHLISNMLALYIFGDNIEDRLGRFRYVAFYLLGGVAASAAHLVLSRKSVLPTIGASGAIAAVLGAYLVLYPRARVVTLVPLFYFARIVQLPALLYLGFWFVSQLFSGTLALADPAMLELGGVAYWAHIGGFVFGLAVIRLFSPRRPPPQVEYYQRPRIYYPDDYRRW